MLEILKEQAGYILATNGTHFTVVGISPDRQVSSAMPGDCGPEYGGLRVARLMSGIEYVSSWYSRGYAQRVFRKLVGEQTEYEREGWS